MKIEPKHIDEIRRRSQAMTTVEDLVALLNLAKPLLYGKNTHPFERKQITYYANPKHSGNRYHDFTVKKKSGGLRTIHAPVKGLKAIQRCLNLVLQCVFEPHKAATGFVPGKSIVNNAKAHTANYYVYNIDLENFFTNIDQARIWKCLQLRPFNLNNTDQRPGIKSKQDALILPVAPGFETMVESLSQTACQLMYDGYNFSEGSWNLGLKDGGNIHYTITPDHPRLDSGVIKIFKNKSQLDAITRLAAKSSQQGAGQQQLVLGRLLAHAIEQHQNKIVSQNTRLQLANIIASLCCTEMQVERKNKETGLTEKTNRNVLPQGAPTSPVLTNIVCQKLDYLLTAVAKRFGCKYTRYADDITFSSLHNVYQQDGEFIHELNRIISEQGFKIKDAKTRLQKSGFRQEVTGLVVNEKVNVRQRYVKELRKWLYLWEQYGYEKAYGLFLNDYFKDRGCTKTPTPNMKFVIKGKLDFLGMVKGPNNSAYKSLLERYKNLSELRKETSLEEVLDVLIDEGLDKAMDIYSRT